MTSIGGSGFYFILLYIKRNPKRCGTKRRREVKQKREDVHLMLDLFLSTFITIPGRGDNSDGSFRTTHAGNRNSGQISCFGCSIFDVRCFIPWPWAVKDRHINVHVLHMYMYTNIMHAILNLNFSEGRLRCPFPDFGWKWLGKDRGRALLLLLLPWRVLRKAKAKQNKVLHCVPL